MRRLLLMLLLPLCLNACASRETFDLDVSSARSWNLPVRFENNLPIIDVMIGSTAVPVVVDTGSNGTIWLAPKVAEKVGVVFTGEASTYYDAHGRAFSARKYVLPQCSLDGIKLRNIEGREFASAAEGGPDIQGIIGLGVLSRFCVIFDWPRGAMELTPGGTARNRSGENFRDVPMRWTGYGVVTSVTMDGTELSFVWDTGASASILKSGRVAEGLLARRDGYFVYVAAHVQIGQIDHGALEFVMQDLAQPPGDGLIGATFFMKHRVLLDLEANVLGVD